MYEAFYHNHLQKAITRGQEISGLCPFHDDHRPSLSANLKTGQFFCHACCAKGNAFSFAKKIGIPFSAVPGYDPNFRERTGKGSPMRTYDYVDENSKLLFQVCRYEPKKFSQRRPNGKGGWTYNLTDVRRVLYRLPEVIKSNEILIVEGEKDVDRLSSLGFVATTNPMGAGKWRPEYNSCFQLKTVIIIPDNDEPGEKHAQNIKSNLEHIAEVVHILPLSPTLGKGADVSDYIDTYGAEKLKQLILNLKMTVISAISKSVRQINPTEMDTAKSFADLLKDRLRYISSTKTWYFKYGTHWRVDKDGKSTRLVMDLISKMSEMAKDENNQEILKWLESCKSRNRLKAIIELLSSNEPISITADIFDRQENLLCCENGIIDLKKGEMIAASQDQYISMSTRIKYDPQAECKRWIRFVQEIFEGDLELIEYVQKAIGLSLTGEVAEQCFFILQGEGANGKSTLLKIIFRLLGDYASSTSSSTFVSSPYDSSRIPSDLYALNKKRFVVANEIKEHGTLNEERLKMITGGNHSQARPLYGEFSEMNITLKLWFAVNHLPKVTDTTDGFWRRVKLIKLNKKFMETECDKNLYQELEKELSGILNWAIEGCLKWRKEGLKAPESVNNDVDIYRDISTPLKKFIKEECTINSDAHTSATELYNTYQYWATLKHMHILTQTKFGIEMKKLGYESQPHGKDRKTHYFNLSRREKQS